MLPRRNSNRVSVESDSYRYIVSESELPDETIALTINVQHDENGAILRIKGLTTTRVPVMESRCYVGRTVSNSITPKHVATLIRRAKQNGWQPSESGPPVILEVKNSELFGSES
jgi:hypothetical protein